MTNVLEQPERPRHLVMWWTRRFSAPLREVYPAESETSDQFTELLEQAEQRIASQKKSA